MSIEKVAIAIDAGNNQHDLIGEGSAHSSAPCYATQGINIVKNISSIGTDS
jgi:hypothetical protein